MPLDEVDLAYNSPAAVCRIAGACNCDEHEVFRIVEQLCSFSGQAPSRILPLMEDCANECIEPQLFYNLVMSHDLEEFRIRNRETLAGRVRELGERWTQFLGAPLGAFAGVIRGAGISARELSDALERLSRISNSVEEVEDDCIEEGPKIVYPKVRVIRIGNGRKSQNKQEDPKSSP